MSPTTRSTIVRATLADLAKVDGKAELIGGRIVHQMPTGDQPGSVAGEIYFELKLHIRATGRGRAYTDGIGFAIPELPSGRESFSPDVAYYVGPRAADPGDFVPGAPAFAVEVRSKSDRGPAAEAAMAAKRADYFAAGTLVVWDVDPFAEIIRGYDAGSTDVPRVFRRGDVADAEPAVPGWRVEVDRLFA